MAERAPTDVTNLDRYGNPALPWSRARDLLVVGPPQPGATFFLATTDATGRPHLAGVGAIWFDGDLYFTSGPRTRKARNLAADADCAIAICLAGLDLTLDGTATIVSEPHTFEAVISRFRATGWPAEVEGTRITGPYSAPSAGPPPWDLYRFRFRTATGVATAGPYGATRWRFA